MTKLTDDFLFEVELTNVTATSVFEDDDIENVDSLDEVVDESGLEFNYEYNNEPVYSIFEKLKDKKQFYPSLYPYKEVAKTTDPELFTLWIRQMQECYNKQ